MERQNKDNKKMKITTGINYERNKWTRNTRKGNFQMTVRRKTTNFTRDNQHGRP